MGKTNRYEKDEDMGETLFNGTEEELTAVTAYVVREAVKYHDSEWDVESDVAFYFNELDAWDDLHDISLSSTHGEIGPDVWSFQTYGEADDKWESVTYFVERIEVWG